MGIPTIEEICCKLDELELSGAGECDGRFLLFAPNRDKAAENLHSVFDPPVGHGWIEFVREGVFEAVLPRQAERPEMDVKAKAPAVPILQAGDEVGPSASDSTGTLGAIVFDQQGQPYLLGAWHSTPSQRVYEVESGSIVAYRAEMIGQFNRFGGSTDCAFAEITSGTVKAILKFGGGYFEPSPGTAKKDEEVEMCGAVTKRGMKGAVVCPKFHCVLVKIGEEFYKFNDQILIYGDRFGDLGDSGGIVLRKSGSLLEALGLFFAISQDFTYSLAHPLTDIFAKIEVSPGLKVHF